MEPWTDEIKMAGPIPEFGIEKGETLQSAMEKIGQAFCEIKKMLDREFYPIMPNISTKNIEYRGKQFAGNGLSPYAKALEGSTIKIEAVRQAQDMTVTFKTTDFDLPPGLAIASTVVNLRGQRDLGRTEIANTTQPELQISIGYHRFPVTLDARVVVATPDGDVELKRQIRILSDKDLVQETPYEIIDRTFRAKPTDLEGLLDQFNSRITSVENFKKVG